MGSCGSKNAAQPASSPQTTGAENVKACNLVEGGTEPEKQLAETPTAPEVSPGCETPQAVQSTEAAGTTPKVTETPQQSPQTAETPTAPEVSPGCETPQAVQSTEAAGTTPKV